MYASSRVTKRHVLNSRLSKTRRPYERILVVNDENAMKIATVWRGGAGRGERFSTIERARTHGTYLAETRYKVSIVSGDRVTCSSSDPRRLPEDSLYPWFSFDELPSYEEDTRPRTEDGEEDDEKEYEERLGMSSASANKLQILWDCFIHAEPQSYEVHSRYIFSLRDFSKNHLDPSSIVRWFVFSRSSIKSG